jgi:hypothetical protein
MKYVVSDEIDLGEKVIKRGEVRRGREWMG